MQLKSTQTLESPYPPHVTVTLSLVPHGYLHARLSSLKMKSPSCHISLPIAVPQLTEGPGGDIAEM